MVTGCGTRRHVPRPPYPSWSKRTAIRNSIFIVSELFFAGFFWAFYHSSLAPTPELGGCWPPTGINPLNPLDIPLLNTSFLLASGVSITWAHHSLMEGNRKNIIQALSITTLLGIYFTLLHASEYFETSFTILRACQSLGNTGGARGVPGQRWSLGRTCPFGQ
jgi:heme/copper-type cytochrome/quinol oxidase subunit 3